MVSQFVGHYATWLIAPALLGIIPFVMLWQQDFSKQAYDTPLPKLYAFFIALWAVRHSTHSCRLAGCKVLESLSDTYPVFVGH